MKPPATSDPFPVGVGFGPPDTDTLTTWAHLADEFGISLLSVGDNPGNAMEMYVAAMALSLRTRRCRAGPAMTNPRSRDPLAIASALSTLEAFSPGRTFLGISTGRARGRGGTVDDLRAHVTAIKELWSEGETVFRGECLRLGWDAKAVPILVGASGPGALRVAGEVADGVVVESGVTPDAIAYARALVAEGAHSRGRDPAGIEHWWYLRPSLAPSSDDALDRALPDLAAAGALVLGRDPAGRGVPRRFHEACRELRRNYDMSAHARAGHANPNRDLIKDDALRDYLADRFACIGTPEEWVSRLSELRDRGVERVFFGGTVPDPEYFASTLGREVLPRLAEGPPVPISER